MQKLGNGLDAQLTVPERIKNAFVPFIYEIKIDFLQILNIIMSPY